MKRLFTVILSLAIVISKSIVFAQVVDFTLISPDTRTLGLGSSSVAVVSNAFGLFNNSASLLFAQDKCAISASYGSWLPSTLDKTVIAGAGFFKTGRKSIISFGYENFINNKITLFDQYGNRTGFFTPKEFLLGTGFSYLITDNLSISSNLKFISSDIGGSSVARAVSTDINLFYKKGIFNLGGNISNIGTSINYGNKSYSLPVNVKLGGSIEKSFSAYHSVLFTGETGLIFDQFVYTVGGGFEYSYNMMLFLRLGAHYGDETKSTPSYVSIGTGIKFYGLTFDMSYWMAKSELPILKSFSLAIGYIL